MSKSILTKIVQAILAECQAKLDENHARAVESLRRDMESWSRKPKDDKQKQLPPTKPQ